MTRAGLIGIAVVLAAIDVLHAQDREGDPAKVKTWAQERVVLLPNRPDSPFKDIAGGLPSCYRRAADNARLPVAQYAGKTGVILAAGSNESGAELLIRVKLDDGEEILACSESSLGFVAEMEMARKLAGTKVWTRGRQKVWPDPVCDARCAGTFELANVQEITLIEPAWGAMFGPIVMRVRMNDGREGYVGLPDLDPRFHLLRTRGGVTSMNTTFHLTNPRLQFSSVSPAVWALVEKGEVAAGMPEKLAEVACGGRMRAEGHLMTPDGNLAALFYCNGRTFTIRDGKVGIHVK